MPPSFRGRKGEREGKTRILCSTEGGAGSADETAPRPADVAVERQALAHAWGYLPCDGAQAHPHRTAGYCLRGPVTRMGLNPVSARLQHEVRLQRAGAPWHGVLGAAVGGAQLQPRPSLRAAVPVFNLWQALPVPEADFPCLPFPKEARTGPDATVCSNQSLSNGRSPRPERTAL